MTSGTTTVKTASGDTITIPPEHRVTHAEFGTVVRSDPRLVPVPSSGRAQVLHWAAAQRLAEMSAAAERAGHGPLLVASGWRPKLWPTRAAYNAAMIEQYGSVAEGRKFRAYLSGHQSGLVIDLGSGGLSPTSRTNKIQMDTPLYRWLLANAATYGFTPYHRESWHWELHTPMDVFEAAPGKLPTMGTRWKRIAAVGAGLVALGAGLLIWRRR